VECIEYLDGRMRENVKYYYGTGNWRLDELEESCKAFDVVTATRGDWGDRRAKPSSRPKREARHIRA
jgi:hypothetical protein